MHRYDTPDHLFARVILHDATPADALFPPGLNPDKPTYVAIKGRVYDVTGNKAYGPEGPYKGRSGVLAQDSRS